MLNCQLSSSFSGVYSIPKQNKGSCQALNPTTPAWSAPTMRMGILKAPLPRSASQYSGCLAGCSRGEGVAQREWPKATKTPLTWDIGWVPSWFWSSCLATKSWRILLTIITKSWNNMMSFHFCMTQERCTDFLTYKRCHIFHRPRPPFQEVSLGRKLHLYRGQFGSPWARYVNVYYPSLEALGTMSLNVSQSSVQPKKVGKLKSYCLQIPKYPCMLWKYHIALSYLVFTLPKKTNSLQSWKKKQKNTKFQGWI